MPTQTLTRTIRIVSHSDGPCITFMRWTGDSKSPHQYSIWAKNLTRKNLFRLDQLTLKADMTSVMTFPNRLVAVSSYWKDIEAPE